MLEASRGDDDLTRRILADQLIEQGDPRGELVVLELEAASQPSAVLTERLRTLREHHRDHLLGALAPLVTEVVWDRGYPDQVRLLPRDVEHLHRARSSPLWRTVRRVDVRPHRRLPGGALSELLAVPDLDGLQVLTGQVPPETLTHPARVRALEELVFTQPGMPPARSLALLETLRRSTHFPGLHTVGLHGRVPPGALPGAPLRTLAVGSPPDLLADWLSVFEQARDLRSLRLLSRLGADVLQLDRRADGLHLRVQSSSASLTVWRRRLRADLAVAEVLQTLPARALAGVDVQLPHRTLPVDRPELQRAIVNTLQHSI